MKVLVIEDDARIASIVQRALQEDSYAVDLADDGPTGLTMFAVNDYDVILLDLLLPGISGGGMEVCRQLRVFDKNTPILMLTALDSVADKIKGLNLGADDYLVKPFHIAELVARVRALVRRTPKADAGVLVIGDLTLNTANHQAMRSRRQIELTQKEYAVLEYLMRNPNRVVSQTEILEHVWDSNYQGLSNVVETYIRYVRKKITLGNESSLIETKRGAGYIIHV